MSVASCYLCRKEIAEIPEATDGFQAMTVGDLDNPGISIARPVHTECMREHDAEAFEFVQQLLSDSQSSARQKE
ncbi:MAG: hypothetical protein AB1631_23610 [Acidobacteriota bacterium]